jgi:hypothetical protein
MTDRPSELPEHEQRAWESIVADLSGQIDLGTQFPKERSLPPLSADGDYPDPLADEEDLEDDEDDEGYQPPHPPPIPRPSDAVGRFAWAAVLGGPVLVITANVLSWDSWLSGLGVAATIGGFVALVARMKERGPDDDDGAVV